MPQPWPKAVMANPQNGDPELRKCQKCVILLRCYFGYGQQVSRLGLGSVYLCTDVDTSGYCTPEILRRISLASSMSHHSCVWRQSWLSNTTKFHIYNSCPDITAMCIWNMDTIESWYSKTGCLPHDEPKGNTWRPLVCVCHKRGSHHPLTAAIHKWSYKSEQTLAPCMAYVNKITLMQFHSPDGKTSIWLPERGR